MSERKFFAMDDALYEIGDNVLVGPLIAVALIAGQSPFNHRCFISNVEDMHLAILMVLPSDF